MNNFKTKVNKLSMTLKKFKNSFAQCIQMEKEEEREIWIKIKSKSRETLKTRVYNNYQS